LKHLHTINVTGVRGMDRGACQDLANALSADNSSVSVIGGNQDGQLTTFCGEGSMINCPYTVVDSPVVRKESKSYGGGSIPNSNKQQLDPTCKHRIDLSDDDELFYSPASPPIAKITPDTVDAYMVMPSNAVHSGIEEKQQIAGSGVTTSTSYTNLTHQDLVDGKLGSSKSEGKLGSGSHKARLSDGSGGGVSMDLVRSRSDNSANEVDAVTKPHVILHSPPTNILSYSRFSEHDLPPNDMPAFLPSSNAGHRLGVGFQPLSMLRAHSEPVASQDK